MVENEIDILKHSLVPKHIILNEDEKLALLLKHKITENQLPKILSSDPVVKAMGAKIGNVIKIIRPSPVADTTEYFRLVVKTKL